MPELLGPFLRERREALRSERGRSYSLRQVAGRIGMEPSYLSRIERGTDIPPGEEKLLALAKELEVNPDALLAMAGKVSAEVQAAVRKQPELFGELIRQLNKMPDNALLKLVREVRDGDW
ncbi:MAG: helix-turn-helix transcriptional regulator [Opitutaceae bacterium]